MPTERWANDASALLTVAVNTAPAAGTVETWTVGSTAGFPQTTGQVRLAVVGAGGVVTEYVSAATPPASGTTLSVTRGVEGPAPVTHAVGERVVAIVTAGALGRLAQVDISQVFTGENTFTSLVRQRHAASSSTPPTYDSAMYDAESRDAIWETRITANRSTFWWHLVVGSEGGATTGGGQGIGIGVGAGKGVVLDLYGDQEGGTRLSRGFEITTFRTGPNAGNDGLADYAIYGQHHKSAPFAHLEMLDTVTGPLLELVAQTSYPDRRVIRWAGLKPDGSGWGGDNEGGYLDAASGRLVSRRGGIDVFNSQYVSIWGGDEHERAFSSHAKVGVIGADFGFVLRRWSGSGHLSTTLSTGSAAGATSISTVAAPVVGQQIMIDTGNNIEVRTVTSVTGSGPYTVGFGAAAPLRLAHSSGAQVYAGSFFTSRIRTDGASMLFEQASGASWAGGEAMDTLVALYQGKNVGLAGFAPGAGGFGGYGAVGVATAHPSFIPSGAITGGGVMFVHPTDGHWRFLASNGDLVSLLRTPALADTSGATLVQLETEVNELKDRLRDVGLMAP